MSILKIGEEKMVKKKRTDIYGKPVSLYRTYNGKKYQFHTIATSKKDLEHMKRYYKKQGYSVRAVKRGQRYQIYTRKGK